MRKYLALLYSFNCYSVIQSSKKWCRHGYVRRNTEQLIIEFPWMCVHVLVLQNYDEPTTKTTLFYHTSRNLRALHWYRQINIIIL
jgi:hypothetical protein